MAIKEFNKSHSEEPDLTLMNLGCAVDDMGETELVFVRWAQAFHNGRVDGCY